MTQMGTQRGLAIGLLGALLSMVMTNPATALPNPTTDPQLMKRLRAGEVISRLTEQGAVRDVLVMGHIKHPAPTAFRVFTDYPRRPSIYESTRKAEVRNTDPLNPRVYYLMNFPWPLTDRWVLDEERLDPANGRLTWRMIDGNVASFAGEAQFFPDGHRHCVMVLKGQADPGIAIIPDWLMNRIQKLLVPGIVRSLTQYMDAGKHLRPAS